VGPLAAPPHWNGITLYIPSIRLHIFFLVGKALTHCSAGRRQRSHTGQASPLEQPREALPHWTSAPPAKRSHTGPARGRQTRPRRVRHPVKEGRVRPPPTCLPTTTILGFFFLDPIRSPRHQNCRHCWKTHLQLARRTLAASPGPSRGPDSACMARPPCPATPGLGAQDWAPQRPWRAS